MVNPFWIIGPTEDLGTGTKRVEFIGFDNKIVQYGARMVC